MFDSWGQGAVRGRIAGEYDGMAANPKSYGPDDCGCLLRFRLIVLPKATETRRLRKPSPRNSQCHAMRLESSQDCRNLELTDRGLSCWDLKAGCTPMQSPA